MERNIIIIKPQGYCAGVNYAINTALEIKKSHPDQKVYILGRLVHNDEVINHLTKEGIISLYGDTYENLISQVEPCSILIFTAHGHDEKLEILAKEKGIICYDAVCPHVKNNLTLIKKEIKDGKTVIYIGVKNHPETVAALSINERIALYDIKERKLYNTIEISPSPLVINQTTLNVLDLKDIHQEIKEKYPEAHFIDEICSTTRMRQEGIINLPKNIDAIIVVGDKTSSNSKRLLEIANSTHPKALNIMIANKTELDLNLLKEKKNIAIASGASTPLETINDIYSLLNNF